MLEQLCSVYPGEFWLSPGPMRDKDWGHSANFLSQTLNGRLQNSTRFLFQRWSLSTYTATWSFSFFAGKAIPVIRLSSISGWCSLFTAKVNNSMKSPCWATKGVPSKGTCSVVSPVYCHWSLGIYHGLAFTTVKIAVVIRDGHFSLHQFFVLLGASQP